MSSEKQFEISKERIDLYLKDLAKEYRKLIGKRMPAEVILVGGASVLVNYGFRHMTTDVDALIHAASCMKDAINTVGNRYELPAGWLNSDFEKTLSYSPKLVECSVYYKTYANVLTVRTVSAEYLIAMKLRSGRQYKSDLSDILGILSEHEKRGEPIQMDNIRKAVSDLYGAWEVLSKTSIDFINNVMNNGRFEDLYSKVINEEKVNKNVLVRFEADYPGIAKESNIEDIIKQLRSGL